jgi:putative Mg2+ transporter-C (MgtC) family protein
MTQFFTLYGEIILRLVTAVGLGMLIGGERLVVHKEAGVKTHALVSLGAAVFMIISEAMTAKYISLPGLSPTIIVGQIIVGIGFLSAGSIMFHDTRLRGLTTAGGLWVTAGIGMASGFGFYSLAIMTTVLVLFVLIVVNKFEEPFRRMYDINESEK